MKDNITAEDQMLPHKAKKYQSKTADELRTEDQMQAKHTNASVSADGLRKAQI